MSGAHRHLVVHGHSPIHRTAPEVKILAAVVFVLGVAVTPRTAIWAFALDAVVVVWLLRTVGYRFRQAVGRFMVVLPFIAFSFFIPFVAGGQSTNVLGIDLSVAGLWASWNIIAKALLGTGVSLILAGTTPIPDFIRGLSRLRVPATLVSIMAFMFRYFDLIVEDLGRIRTAMVARGHDPRWLWQAKPLASAAGVMFVRSYERGERVHSAMLARGFDGHMPMLDHQGTNRRGWLLGMIPAAVSGSAAAISLTGLAG